MTEEETEQLYTQIKHEWNNDYMNLIWHTSSVHAQKAFKTSVIEEMASGQRNIETYTEKQPWLPHHTDLINAGFKYEQVMTFSGAILDTLYLPPVPY